MSDTLRLVTFESQVKNITTSSILNIMVMVEGQRQQIGCIHIKYNRKQIMWFKLYGGKLVQQYGILLASGNPLLQKWESDIYGNKTVIKGIWLLTIQNHFISCLHYCPTHKFHYTFKLVNKARQYFTTRKCRDHVTVESPADYYYYFRHVNIVYCGKNKQRLSYPDNSES